MQARDHHFFFAKKLIPTHTFQSTEKMFSELTGPQREAFLFFLWNEAGKSAPPALPHVGSDAPGELKKLEVVGAVKSGGQEVIVISMPPATQPNEAAFMALARGPEGARVFLLERCLDAAGAGVSPDDAVLAELRADGMRVNHGFKPGVDLEAFKRRVGEATGVSLAGVERSLPEITAAAFVGAAGGGGKTGVGALLSTLLLVRLGILVGTKAIGMVAPQLLSGLHGVLPLVNNGLGALIGILLLVWIYQVYDRRRGRTPRGPGMAVVWWFIPVAQMFMPAVVVHGAWRATVGAGGGLLVTLWWICWWLQIGLQATFSLLNSGVAMPAPLMNVMQHVFGTPAMLIVGAAYGLLWYIVREVEARL
jgi:hypothetical protein